MQIAEHIQEILIGVSSLLGGSGIGFLFSRKKYNTEVESDKIDNLKKALNFYIDAVDDNNLKLNSLREQNEVLETKIMELKNENMSLKDLIMKQTLQIQKLSCEIERLTELINSNDNKNEEDKEST